MSICAGRVERWAKRPALANAREVVGEDGGRSEGEQRKEGVGEGKREVETDRKIAARRLIVCGPRPSPGNFGCIRPDSGARTLTVARIHSRFNRRQGTRGDEIQQMLDQRT